MEVLDKGKATAVTTAVETVDKDTGKVIFESQSTVFIRGSGGFGGKRAPKGALLFTACRFRLTISADRGAASAANTPPPRKPDAVVEEKTLPTQAALYRYASHKFPLGVT